FRHLLLLAPTSTLLPYTTLFRSARRRAAPARRRRRRSPLSHPPAPAAQWRWRDPGPAGSSGRLWPAARSWECSLIGAVHCEGDEDRKSTRLNSSNVSISYAVFCL